MIFRSGFALAQELRLQFRHQFGVFAMRGGDDTELLRQLERAVKFCVVDAERAFVSQKNLEAVDALFDDLGQLRFGFVVEPRDAHVKREIARASSFCLRHPQFESVRHHILVFCGTRHLDNRRCSADQRGFACRLVSLFGECAHKRQIDMHVRVDETGKDILAARVDDSRVWWRIQIFTDP
jgi:hypothetical protein